MTDDPKDRTLTLDVTVRVRVQPARFKPYPAIEKMPEIQRAIRMVEERCIGDLRWMDGVDDVDSITTQIVTDTLPEGKEDELYQWGQEAGVFVAPENGGPKAP